MNKSEIRKKILKIRQENSPNSQEINIVNILKILKKNKSIKKIVGGYYPYNYEIDAIKILDKLEKLGYQISLPKIKKKFKMDFFSWSLKDPLLINKYGIPEPTSDKIVYPNILLVPLVAYDSNLNRIGYGGGFYDRYIKKIKMKNNILTIGLAYSFQKVRQVPTNKYDIKLDFIVNDKEK